MAQLLPVEIDVAGIIAEAKRQLRREADYLLEAESLRRYAGLVADEPRLAVPHGLPIEDLAARRVPQARRDAAAQLLQGLVFRKLFEFRFMQTDPNFANYYVEAESDRIVLLDFGSAREFAPEFSARYARICRAVLDGDREAVRRAAVDIGYLADDEQEERAGGVVDLILLACEPFRRSGVYDFAKSNLASRSRDAGLDLIIRRGFLHPPPPETVFLHRKLVGSFLLCAKIRARVDVQALLRPIPSAAEATPPPPRAALPASGSESA